MTGHVWMSEVPGVKSSCRCECLFLAAASVHLFLAVFGAQWQDRAPVTVVEACVGSAPWNLALLVDGWKGQLECDAWHVFAVDDVLSLLELLFGLDLEDL